MKLQRVLLTALALVVMMSAPMFAQGECSANLTRDIASSADVTTIMELAEELSRKLPTRQRIAQIDDANNRVYLSRVLDHIETARNADKLTALELEEFGAELSTSVASAQIGAAACAVAFSEAEVSAVEFERTAGAAAQAAGCSCVQNCYNEWRANLRTCNGGYWCQVGFNLLFEICLVDCVVPG